MLASLLPGLRDVRTPLTVGYLWLFAFWIWFADQIPTQRPAGNGVIARVFDLSSSVGSPATVAAVSFVAYVLGALLTVQTEGGTGQRVLGLFPTPSLDARETRRQYQELLSTAQEALFGRARGLSPEEFERVDADAHRAVRNGVADLRPRLLVSNQELYGEYDRLEAESSFRINLCPPLLAIGITAGVSVWTLWFLVTACVVIILLYQGLSKGTQAVSVVQRAVVAGIVDHPLASILARFGASAD